MSAELAEQKVLQSKLSFGRILRITEMLLKREFSSARDAKID
jgi:hypothetical protein